MKELFIANDPRFLSGGNTGSKYIDYDGDSVPLAGERVTTEWLVQKHGAELASRGVSAALTAAGQAVHHGKSSYHGRPELNRFLEADDEWPSVGVELETIRRSTPKASREAMHGRLVSNWFHFEDDGSLRSTGDGHECITEPLPSRVYRDVRTWVGLQNILVPYTYSWGTSATGLHVHVGLARFRNLVESACAVPDFIRFDPRSTDLRSLARFLMFHVQMNIADETMLSEVFLRPRGGYCARCSTNDDVVSARMTARDVIAAVAHGSAVNYEEAQSRCRVLASGLQRNGAAEIGHNICSDKIIHPRPQTATGHGAELNADHFATFEFRRGKGTLNGTSIHRMVEYCALVEKYVEKMMTEPDMVPSNHNFRLFLADNTTSAALKETALKTITNAKG